MTVNRPGHRRHARRFAELTVAERTVIRAKQRVYRVATLLALLACTIPIIIVIANNDRFQWMHIATNGVACLICIIAFFLLSRERLVTVVEKVMLGAIISYLAAWDVLNLVSGRLPNEGAVVGSAPAFLLAAILVCLIVPAHRQRRWLLSLYGINLILVWANLLRHPWGDVHNLQISTDIVVLVAVLLLSLISLYQRLVVRAGEEADEMRDLANTDQLTGLPNRRAMYDVLSGAQGGSLVLIDLDDFKVVNDTFGHEHGDEVLTRVANCLSRCAHGVGTVSRWGGEEFLVALHTYTLVQATLWAENAREAVELLPGTETTLSLGVVQRRPNESFSRQLHHADELLYQAKRAGKNRVAAERPQT